MKVIKSIKFEIQPDKEDDNILSRMFGVRRFLWNTALNYKNETYKTYKRRNPCVDVKEEKTLVNSLMSNSTIQKAFATKNISNYEDFEWITSLPNRAQQQNFNDLNKAFSKFYKGKGGYPKFKKKNGKQSVRFLDGISLNKSNSKHTIIKIGRSLKFITKNPERNNKRIYNENTKILSITISRTQSGKHYASVNYSYETDDLFKVSTIRKVVGVDRGVTITASLSDGSEHKINQKEIKKIQERRKFLQKQLKRKVKGSNK